MLLPIGSFWVEVTRKEWYDEGSKETKEASPVRKIIFLDVDGTLVDYEGNLPPSAVSAVRCARAKGHRVYLCTGRIRPFGISGWTA